MAETETNWDYLKTLNAEEFSEVFWKILQRSKYDINSRVWLKEWLKSPKVTRYDEIFII